MTEASSNVLVLDSQHVATIFVDCLFRGDESTAGYVEAQGIMRAFAFHAERLESNRDEIGALLGELPDRFMESSPEGGWSFLDMCYDKHGNQWTSTHTTMEELLCLGLATRQAEYLFPRDTWDILPGNMPYISVKDKD